VRLSVTWKLALLLIAATGGTVLAVGAYDAYIQRNDSGNYAVLQSLTNRCEHLHRRIDNPAPLSDTDRRELRSFAAAADSTRQALEQGGEIDGHSVAPLSPEIATILSDAKAQWPAARTRLLTYASADSGGEAAARERLHGMFPRYQAEMQGVERALERRRLALTTYMRNTLVLVCSVHGIFLVAGMFAARRFIVRPVLLSNVLR
jgi:hypothetical protein